jgi:hypothetical protein
VRHVQFQADAARQSLVEFKNTVVGVQVVPLGRRRESAHDYLSVRARSKLRGFDTREAAANAAGDVSSRLVKLLRYGRPVPTIFDLLGSKEDDMTYSLGYVVSRSPCFADELLRHVAGVSIPRHDEGVVKLQTVVTEHGRTDVEIRVGDDFFGIFEAKRGPHLPTLEQLALYAPLLAKARVATKRLVAVTNAPPSHADHSLPKTIDGVPVMHVSWRTIRSLAERARADEANHNKRLLDEFAAYLREILGMEITRSNMVYVVSLGGGNAWNVNFRDVVQRQRRYFFPTAGGGWPEPPNYIAFRYDGKLQSIHHVDGYDVFTNPKTVFSEAQDVTVKPHYCIRLGPPIQAPKEVRNGPKILRSMRVWCMIDTLLTSGTITEALAETKRRLGEEASEVELETPGDDGEDS